MNLPTVWVSSGGVTQSEEPVVNEGLQQTALSTGTVKRKSFTRADSKALIRLISYYYL